MLDILKGRVSDRKGRLFACACLRGVDQMGSLERVRGAVEIAEGLADDGTMSEDADQVLASALQEQHTAFQGSFQGVGQLRYFQAAAAVSVLSPDPWYAAWVSVAIKCKLLSRSTARAREEVVKDETRQRQCNLLRCIFGNPFRTTPDIDPSWLAWDDGIVVKLAQAAYDHRELPSGALDNARLGVLADALEEAGCDKEAILSHLREQGKFHVRGCFVVDALLGKS
jgi:hypothetical protein